MIMYHLRQPEANPRHIVSDCEIVFSHSLHATFPDATMQGCYVLYAEEKYPLRKGL